jgi:hypothetical protein
VQRGDDAWLSAQILGIREQLDHAIAHRLKQERTHHRHVSQPQWVEVMRERKNHMVVITGQKPRLLESQPALGLKVGALRARPVPTRVVPDARHMAIRTGLDMSSEYRRSALHEGACGSTDVGGQGMRLLIRRKGVLEDRLQRDERHWCLRTYSIRISSGGFVQYHANYPRCKRLVQSRISAPPSQSFT